MPITASDIFSDVRALLDDDNSARYTEAADLVPALNKAVLWLVAVFNSAFEQKKLSPESLRELSTVRILPVTGTNTKKCDLSSITNLWTLTGVEPSPTTTGAPGSEVLSESVNRFATRMTLENWNFSLGDPFSAGSNVSILTDFVVPGYLGPGNFFGDGKQYIMIRPASAFTTNFVGIWYLQNPTKVLTGTSILEFPRSLHGVLVDKTLNIMSIQHGPESVYNKVTEKELSTVVGLMLN